MWSDGMALQEAINAIPSTIAALAALVAANRTGAKGSLSRKLGKLERTINRHVRNSVLHPNLTTDLLDTDVRGKYRKG